MNNSEINRLGEKLRLGNLTPEILAELDSYRRSFQPAIAEVVRRFERLSNHYQPVQRPSKSTPSIVAKLIRQPTLKLSQIQDIAGLRLVALDRSLQKMTAAQFKSFDSNAKVIDRNKQPSFGYRAIHVVVKQEDRPIEIQIRTVLQQAWAQLSENLADKHGHDIKYGGGNPAIQNLLLDLSDQIEALEKYEYDSYFELPGDDKSLLTIKKIDAQKNELLDRMLAAGQQN